MPFYVVGNDGNRYGPGEMSELADWASEGRLRPETELEETSTGIRFRADAILEGFAWPAPGTTTRGTTAGAGFGTEYPRPFGGAAPISRPRKPWVAGLLTFLLCGAGQMYNRQVAKGFVFLLVCLVLGILTHGPGGYLVTALAFADAYRTTQRLNASQNVGPWSLF